MYRINLRAICGSKSCVERREIMMKRKRILISVTIIAAITACMLIVLIANDDDTAKVQTIGYDGDLSSVHLNDDAYYALSPYYGVRDGIYDEYTYERLENIQYISDYETYKNALTVYYTDTPIVKYFLKEKVVEKNLYGNTVCFMVSDDDELYVQKNIKLPELAADNVSKIVVSFVDGDTVYATENEIHAFFENIDDNLEALEKTDTYQTCQIYYKNTDADICEVIDRAILKSVE